MKIFEYSSALFRCVTTTLRIMVRVGVCASVSMSQVSVWFCEMCKIWSQVSWVLIDLMYFIMSRFT